MDAAHIRELAGMPEVARVVEVGHVLRRIQPLDRAAGNRREGQAPLLVLLQNGLECLSLPALLVSLDGGGFRHGAINYIDFRPPPDVNVEPRTTNVNVEPRTSNVERRPYRPSYTTRPPTIV
jgi:hypothetical protein